MSGTSSRADIRAELAPYLGQRRKFYATFSHYGKRRLRYRAPWGLAERMVDTLLFVDVRNEWGRYLCDHVWFTSSLTLQRVGLEAGDTVSFVATVDSYTKRDRWANEYSRIEDYKLCRPSMLEKVRAPLEVGQATLE